MFSINSKTILDPHPGAGIMGVSHHALVLPRVSDLVSKEVWVLTFVKALLVSLIRRQA